MTLSESSLRKAQIADQELASALFPSSGDVRESWSDLTGLLDGRELEAP